MPVIERQPSVTRQHPERTGSKPIAVAASELTDCDRRLIGQAQQQDLPERSRARLPEARNQTVPRPVKKDRAALTCRPRVLNWYRDARPQLQAVRRREARSSVSAACTSARSVRGCTRRDRQARQPALRETRCSECRSLLVPLGSPNSVEFRGSPFARLLPYRFTPMRASFTTAASRTCAGSRVSRW